MRIFKYLGLFLAFFGIAVILIYTKAYAPSENLISAWIVWSALSVSSVLPLLGFGFGLALVPLYLVLASIISFFIGFYIGIINYDKVWFLLSNSPNAAQHFYLTLPIASFCSGILLLVPKTIRNYLFIPFALIIGAMVAITTKLTDPTLHDPIIIKLGLIIAIWIILSSTLSVRFFYREWFMVVIRIFASWLLASSLLYGGTIVAVKYGYFTPKSTSVPPIIKIDSSVDDIMIPDFGESDLDDKGTN